MLVADDSVVEAIERWKKRAISAFALLSLLIAILVALTIEVGALVNTVHRELPGAIQPPQPLLREPRPGGFLR